MGHLPQAFVEDDFDSQIRAPFFHGFRNGWLHGRDQWLVPGDNGDLRAKALEEMGGFHTYGTRPDNDHFSGHRGHCDDVVAGPVRRPGQTWNRGDDLIRSGRDDKCPAGHFTMALDFHGMW